MERVISKPGPGIKDLAELESPLAQFDPEKYNTVLEDSL